MESISHYDVREDLINAAKLISISRLGILSIISQIDNYLDEEPSRNCMKVLTAVYYLIKDLPKTSRTKYIEKRLSPEAFETTPPTVDDINNFWSELTERQRSLLSNHTERLNVDALQLEDRLRQVDIRFRGRVITLTVKSTDVLIFPRRNSKPGKFLTN